MSRTRESQERRRALRLAYNQVRASLREAWQLLPDALASTWAFLYQAWNQFGFIWFLACVFLPSALIAVVTVWLAATWDAARPWILSVGLAIAALVAIASAARVRRMQSVGVARRQNHRALDGASRMKAFARRLKGERDRARKANEQLQEKLRQPPPRELTIAESDAKWLFDIEVALVEHGRQTMAHVVEHWSIQLTPGVWPQDGISGWSWVALFEGIKVMPSGMPKDRLAEIAGLLERMKHRGLVEEIRGPHPSSPHYVGTGRLIEAIAEVRKHPDFIPLKWNVEVSTPERDLDGQRVGGISQPAPAAPPAEDSQQ